jgi:HEAT repeat protein
MRHASKAFLILGVLMGLMLILLACDTSMESIEKNLKSPNWKDRKAAVKHLGRIKTLKATELLIAALNDRNFWVGMSAVDQLARKKTPQAFEAILSAVSHESYRIRGQAIKRLGDMGDDRAVQPLIKALQDKKDLNRAAAAESLGKLNSSQAVGPLISCLKDRHHMTRYKAAWALGVIKDHRAIGALTRLLRDHDTDVRTYAARALYALGWSPAKLEQKCRFLLLTGRHGKDLLQIGSAAVEPLCKTLRDKDMAMRGKAAFYLAEIGDERAVPCLVDTLTDWRAMRHWASGRRIREALQKFKWKPAIQAEQVHLWIALRDEDELEDNWDTVKLVLLKDVVSNRYQEVENALFTFICMGKKELIPELVERLHQRGNKNMAIAYLNCGNSDLRTAAEKWAHSRGYRIITRPGSGSIKWGSFR